MMELALVTAAGQTGKGIIQLSETAFDCAFNEPLIHQVVNAQMAATRAGTRSQKTRAQVRGGGAKPWRQKGTGRARAGSIRSPLWRGGGKVFAAVPVSHRQKVNKKMYRSALRSILSELVRQDRLLAVENFSIDVPKTKALLGKLNTLGLENVLIVVDTEDRILGLAARNLPYVEVKSTEEVDPLSLIRHEKVLITADAIKRLEERLV